MAEAIYPKYREVQHCSGCGKDHVILFYSLLERDKDGFTEEGKCLNSDRTILAREEPDPFAYPPDWIDRPCKDERPWWRFW